ncbi:hypothetical protein WQ54_22075 [Bacillus sp. SA1-12]|uniref:hypothetical protein n=1 Tax=Bacillus sp. SA1-12 TaxID=1455638 RepID=UPI000626F8A8|nr:hypothetical protein [Bacillus sp. SA1-12]KKI89842.1 hypothetical protein WQ54_22075 [Bacillus sp. SA1-12]
MGSNFATRKKNYFLMFLAYLFSVVTAVIGILLWFTIRETLMITLTHVSFNFWSLPAIDNFSFLLLGIGWLVLVYASNFYYRKGYREGAIWPAFFLISGSQALLFFICKLIMISIGYSAGVSNILIAMIECLAGAGLIIMAKKMTRNKLINKNNNLTS